jgi:Cdc6-like AAA superfamily ATPase
MEMAATSNLIISNDILQFARAIAANKSKEARLAHVECRRRGSYSAARDRSAHRRDTATA